eukprot:113327-Pleurochrysis_carterae.AAC.2
MSLTPPNYTYRYLPQMQITDSIPVKSTLVTLVHGSWATVLIVHGSSVFSHENIKGESVTPPGLLRMKVWQLSQIWTLFFADTGH